MLPWVSECPDELGEASYLCPVDNTTEAAQPICDPNDSITMSYLDAAKHACEDPTQIETIFQHVILVLAARFFEDSRRFFDNGRGVGVGIDGICIRPGCHFLHGPTLPTPSAYDGRNGPKKDIVILRPNIEHEMLGIIMGRGGTQELGATFWGQTELSCYDDAQHGIWGMSYKYHERAMVTNERNLIRVFDVAFDGYNGGMDQQAVNWNSAESRQQFRDATYARDRPYNGPSMLVMALPHNPQVTRCNWPNPVMFHNNFTGNPTPDPQKDDRLPDIEKYMVFSSQHCDLCSPAQEAAYQAYMTRLEMPIWASLDQTSRPAGECCISNESTANMLAFQGTMKVYDIHNGSCVDHIQGSGHLGPSYVGVASIREGRGILNTHMQPQMIRQI